MEEKRERREREREREKKKVRLGLVIVKFFPNWGIPEAKMMQEGLG